MTAVTAMTAMTAVTAVTAVTAMTAVTKLPITRPPMTGPVTTLDVGNVVSGGLR
jgi:hypothetical protein